MKTRLLILIFLTVSIMIPVNSFAEPVIKTENGFHEGTIEWISRCFMIGSTITVRVTDYDMNIDPNKIEQFNVKVWSDFDLESDFENRIIDYMVTETGANTGVFDSKVFLITTDDSPGKRIRVIDNSIVFAKYVDYTVSNAVNSDVIEIFNISGLSVLERNDDGRMSKITYDPCAIELFEKNKDKFDELDIFYPAPLKQIKSEITFNEIQCKENLVLIQKYDGSPACVQPETIQKLIDRNWTTQSIVHDIVFKTMSKNLGPECEQTTMDDIISGIVDEKCSKFIDELANEQQLEMIQRGYSFDQEKKSWVKYGYPDTMMSIADYYQQNLKIVESEPTTIEELLVQNQIDYLPDKLIVTSGPVIRGDPGCGAVIDSDSTTHWFGIDSISEPKEITLFSENPNQCEVNTTSCFCNAHMELSSLTLDELNYFTLEEQEKFAKILIDYLSEENINRTPKFQFGKINLNYTDSSAIGYCGEIWGKNTYGFFDGAIVNDVVMDYGISKELPLLCAISDDVKWWERK